MTTPDDLDRSDMERLAKGDDSALNALMERHGEKLFHCMIRLLGNEQDAEDLAQETFVRVYQNREKFDARQKFTTWLYTIATNLCRDRLRYRSRHRQVSLEAETGESETSLRDTIAAEHPGPAEQAARAESAEAVRRAIATLPEELRTSFILFEYESQSHAAIAAILNCSAKGVETRLYRARLHLRKILGESHEPSQ